MNGSEQHGRDRFPLSGLLTGNGLLYLAADAILDQPAVTRENRLTSNELLIRSYIEESLACNLNPAALTCLLLRVFHQKRNQTFST